MSHLLGSGGLAATGGLWIGHFGMVVDADDGTRNVIHSAAPRVREQTLSEIVGEGLAADREPGKVRLIGLTFLRLNEDALSALEAIDGADAPRVTLPDGSAFDPADVPLNPPTTQPVTAAAGG